MKSEGTKSKQDKERNAKSSKVKRQSRQGHSFFYFPGAKLIQRLGSETEVKDNGRVIMEGTEGWGGTKDAAPYVVHFFTKRARSRSVKPAALPVAIESCCPTSFIPSFFA